MDFSAIFFSALFFFLFLFFCNISFLHYFSIVLFSAEIGLVSPVSDSYVLFIVLFVFYSIWFLCIDYYPQCNKIYIFYFKKEKIINMIVINKIKERIYNYFLLRW